ncbi:M23 family metallopeptidase [Candidatus Uhrbacteria bacterium]|nr:M23 family metallopeptidase [Candidatus Uhrbacteria bacterium]
MLPFYKISVIFKLRAQRLAIPARGLALYIITNRYAPHIVLLIVLIITIGGNLKGRTAYAQDIGQKSLLFAIASDEHLDITEEQVNTQDIKKDTKYLSSGTIDSVPHIDFDYDEENDPVQPSLSVPGAIIIQPYDMEDGEKSKTPRTKTETYLVKEGDTVSSIAQAFDVNVGTILWNNNLTERQYIRPGDSLKIPPVSGIVVTTKSGDTLSKIATKYGGDPDEISTFNHINGDQLALGSEIVIPGGKPPEIEQTRTQILARRDDILRSSENTTIKSTIKTTAPKSTILADLVNPPSTTKKPKDLDTTSLPKTRLLWPTSGHVITQYYGWKHTGVDIDGDYSSPLYAAADGVVETAAWNSGGYGLQIIIDHPNGMKTRYAHSSKLFVKVGDTVKKGQVIAMMGTTGRSTGTHLHFEVYVNNKRTNPLTYIR